MATTKNDLTQIKALEIVIAEGKVENSTRPADVQAKLEEVYNALVKKKENRKPKKVSEADMVDMATIKATLEKNGKLTVSEIIAKTEAPFATENISTSKVTALLKKIEGVQNAKEGKKSLYFLA